MKLFPFLVLTAASFAIAASTPAQLADELFGLQKEAAAQHEKISKRCAAFKEGVRAQLEGKTPEQKEEFYKEFRYQMRQNAAKLGKDDPYLPAFCGIDKGAGMHHGHHGHHGPKAHHEPKAPKGPKAAMPCGPDCPMAK